MRIAAAVLAAIEAHARDADPHECCGLLVGHADAIASSVRASNRAAHPERRYEIEPQEHFAAIRRARAEGLEVVGAYHSHPRSEPVPSPTDHAEAFENFVFVIAGRRSRSAEPTADARLGRLDGPNEPQPFTIRAWRFSSGNFTELALVSEP